MKEKLHPFQVALLIYMIQSGVTLFSIPRLSAEAFGTNGWIGIVILFGIVTLNILLIGLVNKYGNGQSLFMIIENIFPKWLFVPFYLFLSIIFTLLATLVTKKYILLLQMLFFRDTPSIIFVGMFFILSFFLLKGCIYEIGKATVILFFMTIWTMLLLTFHLSEFSFTRMTTFMMKGDKDLFSGGLNVFSAFLGYELSIFLIPYVRKNFTKGVFFGNAITSFIYISVSFVCYGFFSFEYILHDLYPVISLIEYVKFPFVERVENLIFTLFALKVLITVVMYLWASKELISHSFQKLRPNFISLLLLTVGTLISFIPDIIREVDQWLTMLTYFDIGIAFLLPIFLLLLIGLNKVKQKKVTL
ncbi:MULTISPECIES: GerAB/ArcD/ProY family transporter [Bacillaceae]|uniref:GerAB/ArcD/ProY family transporter n=1 Tax=Bacillaceae TaxID=186817 RepID=UPI001C562938|nr:GerAB/ArcD/ProY family transporter [Rossellomorea sp. YZS02]MBW3113432.1 spore germination protein [Bacillus sp. MCCB 382]MDX8344874.1 GerAB/ArcD/ProY family transporter [Rossellomorea sp. YZS02]